METQDEGDAEAVASPRDIIYTEPAKIEKDEHHPDVLYKLDLRYRCVRLSLIDDFVILLFFFLKDKV